MTTQATVISSTPGVTRRPAGLARRLVHGRLALLRQGSLTIQEGDHSQHFGTGGGDLTATIRVLDQDFYGRLLRSGSIGAAEAFMDGLWEADDLTAVIRILVRNQDVLTGVDSGLAKIAALPLRLWHSLNRNTGRGSRKNISAHYDLSNEFFSLFLDETMTYSSGVFESEQSTMKDASLAKIDRLCRKLELRPEHHLLEIGTGWGAFALHAAREYGCRVTTTTISRQQYEFARKRIAEAGLGDRIELLQEDYRHLTGRFDRLVSVEMIEAVGHQYYDSFFEKCSELLTDDGLMAMQAITISDQHYDQARRSVDFIQRYIFPGSCIPSVTALSSSMTRSSELRLKSMDDITPHYVRTLREWRLKFTENIEDIRALGFDERFLRMWEFYLRYSEGGFAERHISDVHMLLAKPGHRDAALT